MYASLIANLRRRIYNSNWLYYIRLTLAMMGTTILPWWLQQITWTIPLTLGVVAAALTDLDDRFSGRLRNLVITLICFCTASVSVELLFPYPWFFIVGLAISSWGFILLGALGPRYATIAFGALLIAIYTMLGIKLFPQWYMQPALLLLGAVWYNLLTLCGHIIFPIRPLQENLARCYAELALYLDAKAGLFDPDLETDDRLAMVEVAMANSKLVTLLNHTKASIQSRLRGDRGQRGTQRTLHYYFVAQDIHERASSSHMQYHTLRSAWGSTDILFRFQRLLTLQARACRQLSRDILLHEKYQHDEHFERVFTNLETALQRLTAQQPHNKEVKAMHFLFHNLKAIDAQLAVVESEQATAEEEYYRDRTLSSEGLTGLGDIRLRLSLHMSAESPLFRHAVRLSVLLCSGYAFIQLTGLQHGYWILLTSLFVCQPNYSATKKRLALRVIGTLAGIVIGLPLLWLVPSIEGQLMLIIVTGVMFFVLRTIQYAHATMFITLLVLLCFNLLGEGFEVALPRIIDTLIGCGMAWLAVAYIWPDWRFFRLPAAAERTLGANCRYLNAVFMQYRQGKDNRLDYRVARREAHNADAELAAVVSQISVENRADAALRETGFRLLCLNHSFLSYISALGAHREKIDDRQLVGLMSDTMDLVKNFLNNTDENESGAQVVLASLMKRIDHTKTDNATKAHLILQQIGLLVALLPEITQLKQQIIAPVKE